MSESCTSYLIHRTITYPSGQTDQSYFSRLTSVCSEWVSPSRVAEAKHFTTQREAEGMVRVLRRYRRPKGEKMDIRTTNN